MINITDKSKCVGCNACVQKCPKQCIAMHEDEEGFLYPIVDENLCIDCHLCEKVCPVLNQDEPRVPLACYAAKNPNEDIRMESSSGGIFTMLAEKVIDEGGVVFGAAFNRKWQVAHSYTEDKKGLAAFRGSKYVQSLIGNTYKEAEKFLKEGRLVLFSGTPCQIAGLKKFLRKIYENLLTVDFICHGVPSPGVFRWYLQEEVNNYAARKGRKNSVSFPTITSIPKGDVMMPEGLSIMGIRFRDKCEGWKKFSFVLQLAEASAEGKKNTVSFSSNLQKNAFIKGFLKDLYLRPSCYACPAKELKSGSDITIADFWGVQSVIKDFDDDKGTSLIIINTESGDKIVKSIDAILQESSYVDACRLNSAILKSCIITQKRKMFLKSKGNSFASIVNILTKKTLIENFVDLLHRAIRKIRK